ncbi:unnamed protein product [Oikopleura dioica]|uniref:YHYH domain-containing protein n=1 Tax=Oikopleura dioica TaxID=34765 RepID=E4WRI7_OIKDI|nr:unnamed protein product [Oikopleura dioica]
MRLFVFSIAASTAGEIALNNADIAKFRCKSTGSWQLPQSCGSTLFTSNGIPDHNACAAAPQSTVDVQNYSYKIPREPVYRTRNLEDFETTNMGEIGFAINGVPFYNPYDAACCDAGLYELHALDLCYAHPNGQGGKYHYHVWSPCIAECTGASEFVGIALDGFPIYGPGINPDTGMVWSQSDMDFCGGKEVDGKYAYYVTVDFPYVLQCYRGETSSTFRNGEQFQGSGNCAANNEGCSPGNMAMGGTGGPSGRPAGPPGRKRRDVKDPTESWFNELEYLSSLGNISSYSGEILSKVGSRRRRSVATLSAAIDDVIAAGDARFTKNIYLKHLSYQCNSCNGARDLNTDCTGILDNTCTGVKSVLTIEGDDSSETSQDTENQNSENENGGNGSDAITPIFLILFVSVILT